MTLMVNGEPRETADALTVQELLEFLMIRGDAVAVEVNRDVVPRVERVMRRLAEGDRVEIVTFVGGG